jgi:16S rRNA (cytosine1402-N4)-methyltransferase
MIQEEDHLAIFLLLWRDKRSQKLARKLFTLGKLRKLNDSDLKNVFSYIPQFKQNKFFAQLFQAISIEVNQELEVLKNAVTVL